MSEMAITKNHSDLSDGTGFQFEFYCEHCQDSWRTEYHRYAAGTASSILDTASSLLGGFFGGADRVVGQVKDAGYKTARDKAFVEAQENAKTHFHRCRRCGNYFCAQCYNPSVNLCISCAPSVEEEGNVAARQTEIEMARERAQSQVTAGKLKTDDQVICTACKARVSVSKFCGECGAALEVKNNCWNCSAEVKPGTKFCPECGEKQ